MVHHVRVGQTPDSLEAREMINERACELLQAVQGSELRSGDDLEGFLLVLSGKMMVGRKSQIFLQIYTGQTTVRDSRKFDEKFEELFFFPQISEICGSRKVLDIFFGIQNVYGPILDQCFRVQI